MATIRNSYSKKVKDRYNQNVNSTGINIPSGIYRGIVVSNADPQPELGLGRLKVHISSLYAPIFPQTTQGATTSTTTETADEYIGAVWCLRMVPYGGTYIDGQGQQMSSGIFYPPPDINNEVVVAFTGDYDKGIILGVLPSRIENMAGPTAKPTETGQIAPSYDVPDFRDTETKLPPEHPQATALREQGLDKDTIRGPSYSNPLRDFNSKIVGISSPKGHSITLDDGFAEEDASNNIRLRTGRGGQILMDDNYGLIYIINQNGSAWIELNRNGDIDIFSGGSINYHTVGNFNVHADGSINLQAQNGVNFKTCGGFAIETSGGNIDLYSSMNINITADADGNIKAPGGLKITSNKIDMNGAAADTATKPTSGNLIGNKNVTESISGRVPEREPWSGHLDYAQVNTSSGVLAEDLSTYPGAPIDPQAFNEEYPPSPEFPSGFVRFSSNMTTEKKKIDPNLLKLVEQIAIEFGKPLIISSGFATKGHATNSMHYKGRAVDISQHSFSSDDERLRVINIASAKGIGGIGAYSGGSTGRSIHLDNRESKEAWGNSFHYDRTIPPYARAALARHTGKPMV